MSRLVLVSNAFRILVLAIAFLIPAPSSAGNGEALFSSLRCNTCHKPDQKSVASSLADIARVYGDEEKLIKFFKGESKPLIETDKAGMMRGQMRKLVALSDEDKKILAEYVLGFK